MWSGSKTSLRKGIAVIAESTCVDDFVSVAGFAPRLLPTKMTSVAVSPTSSAHCEQLDWGNRGSLNFENLACRGVYGAARSDCRGYELRR